MMTLSDLGWVITCIGVGLCAFYFAHDSITDSNAYKEGQCLLKVHPEVLAKYTENTIDGAREFCKIHPVEEKKKEEPKECTFSQTTPEKIIIDVGKTLKITRYPDKTPCIFGDVTVTGKIVIFEDYVVR